MRVLPPSTSPDDFRERLIAMEDADQIAGFTDRSADAIDVAVKFKRGSIKGWDEKAALDFLKLRTRDTERIVCVNWDGETIRVYDTPEEVVRDFAAWRLGWYEKRFRKMSDDAAHERAYWLALDALFAARFPARLGKFADRAAVEADVSAVAAKAKLSIDAQQMDRITGLPTYRWTQEFAAEVKARIAALDRDLAGYAELLASEDRRRAVFMEELEALKKLKV